MSTSDAGGTSGRDWLTFDRYDRWGLAALLGLAVVSAVVAWVVGPLVMWARGEALPVQVVTEVSVPALDASGLTHGDATYDVFIEGATAGQRLLAILPGLLWVALVLGGCVLVLRLMRTVASGDPFNSSNVRRLRVLAGGLILGAPIVVVVDSMVRGVLASQVDLGSLALGVLIVPPWLAMIGGMVVALLAEAFKAGSRLREDVEGLV